MTVTKKIEDVEKKVSSLAKFKMSPTEMRIMSFTKDLIVAHNSLIVLKASSLSAKERKMIQGRIAYGLMAGTITKEEIAASLKKLMNISNDSEELPK